MSRDGDPAFLIGAPTGDAAVEELYAYELAPREPVRAAQPALDLPDLYRDAALATSSSVNMTEAMAQWAMGAFADGGIPYARVYRQSVIVYAIVNRIASDLARLKLRWFRENGEEVRRAPGNVVDVLADPNPRDTEYSLKFAIYASTLLHGRAFLEKKKGDFGTGTAGARVVRLDPVLGQFMVPIADSDRNIVKYVRLMPDGTRRDVRADLIVPFVRWSPEDSPAGMSPLEPSSSSWRTRQLAQEWNHRFYKIGAMVAGFFRYEGDGMPELAALNNAEMRLKEKQGVKKAWDPIVIGTLKFERAGLTQKEMQYLETVEWTDADICRTFGIPPSIVGLNNKGSLTGESGYRVDWEMYAENTLGAEAHASDQVFTEFLGPDFEPGIYAETNLRAHPALAARTLETAKALVLIADGPVWTPNEAREFMGNKPLPGEENDQLRRKADPLGIPAEPEDEEDEEPAPATKSTAQPEAWSLAQRAARTRQADANTARYMPPMRRAFLAVMARQQRSVLAGVRAQAASAGPAPEQLEERAAFAVLERAALERAASVDDYLAETEETDKAEIRRAFAKIVKARGKEALADLGLTVGLSTRNARVARWLEENSDRALSQTTATTRKRLNARMADTLREGGGLNELVETIDEVFRGRRDNALIIARTETGGAYGFATREAWAQSKRVAGRIWRTADDELVRDEHQAVDGQFAAIDEPFIVAGVPMLYVGDPTAPVGLTANCRCFEEPVLLDEDEDASGWERQWDRELASAGHAGPPARAAKA